MANEPENNTKAVLSALNNPQFKEVISVTVVLGILLLFARDLADPSGFRNYLISAVAVYLIGTVLLVQTQINLINHAINQAAANRAKKSQETLNQDKETARQFPSFSDLPIGKRHSCIASMVGWYENFSDICGYVTLRSMPVLRCILFVLLVSYLFWRKCL